MNILSVDKISGDVVNLKVTNQKHISGAQKETGEEVNGSSFGDLLKSFVDKTNDLELKSTELSNMMAIDPDSVDIHDVQIAAEEAEMAVLFTKGIVDRAIRAYKEIVNLR